MRRRSPSPDDDTATAGVKVRCAHGFQAMRSSEAGVSSQVDCFLHPRVETPPHRRGGEFPFGRVQGSVIYDPADSPRGLDRGIDQSRQFGRTAEHRPMSRVEVEIRDPVRVASSGTSPPSTQLLACSMSYSGQIITTGVSKRRPSPVTRRYRRSTTPVSRSCCTVRTSPGLARSTPTGRRTRCPSGTSGGIVRSTSVPRPNR